MGGKRPSFAFKLVKGGKNIPPLPKNLLDYLKTNPEWVDSTKTIRHSTIPQPSDNEEEELEEVLRLREIEAKI